MRILITGSNGLLGQKLVKHCLRHHIEFLATSKGGNRNPDCPNDCFVSMDITNPIEVVHIFNSYYPTHIIHTAAITNVDYCELHPEECYKSNVYGTHVLFNYAKEFQTHFQLLSTDFVFDGQKGLYNEEDEVNPLSVYAQSKVDAEHLLKTDSYENWSIIRTIIVYGTGHNLSRSNLILWAIDALTKGEKMRVIDDQYRMPTWADDLAWGCLAVFKKDQRGIFHLCGPELLSIFQIVERIAQFLDVTMDNVERINSLTLNQPAKRPPKTGFDLDKSIHILGYHPTKIEETLFELTSIN